MNSMNVGELIAILQAMPQDAVVMFRMCSDYTEMRPDEVRLSLAESKEFVWRFENGYQEYNKRLFKMSGEVPKFVTACVFPGN
jgi:hypothetical protein